MVLFYLGRGSRARLSGPRQVSARFLSSMAMADETTLKYRSSGPRRAVTKPSRSTWAVALISAPDPQAAGEVVPLGDAATVLGRADSGAAEDGLMSRRQATLSCGGESVCLRDGAAHAADGWRGSANGTWVAGRDIGSERVVIGHGDTFLTGDTLWMVVRDPMPPVGPTRVAGISRALGVARDEVALIASQVAVRLKRGKRVRTALLVTGQRGVGKQVMAQEAVRVLSLRRGGADVPFLQVSAPTLSDGTVAADLFGVVRGYATGVSARPGYFTQAHGGALLLDEIGDTPLTEQAKLLTVLEEREVVPLGGQRASPFDCLVVSTTNRDLSGMCEQKLFRADLLDRLSRFHIHVPPLAERPEDVPFIAHALLRRHDPQLSFDPQVIEELVKLPWPGNVRALDALVERVAVLAEVDESATIDLAMLHRALERVHHVTPSASPSEASTAGSSGSLLKVGGRLRRSHPPREELLRRLMDADWNLAEVGREYDKDRRQILRWMSYLDIERPD